MRRIILYSAAAALLVIAAYFVFVQPSNERDWRLDQSRMPYGVIEGDSVTLYNVRNFTYTTVDEYEAHYYDATYDLNDLERVYYIVEPIADWEGAAHTFFSFDFGDRYVAMSVEARKEEGETYGMVKGLLRRFELLYVFGDEEDLVQLRAVQRNHSVYLYPINTTPERARLLFIDMVERANTLQTEPEFYNTLTSTCTTNLVDHANTIVPGRIPFSYEILAPGYADEFAYELGLLDTTVPLEELREKHDISDRARVYDGSVPFSQWIRSE
jgi:hypothetical protein